MTTKHPSRLILIVDDSPEDRELYRRYFRKQSHDSPISFLEADMAQDGLNLAAIEKPQCILLDYNLPDMDGLEFLKELSEKKIEIPVIMLTGQGNESVAVEAMKRGAVDYLIKGSLDTKSLNSAVSNAIEKAQLKALIRNKQKELEEFVHIAAHDLKSPLIVVSGIAELLQAEYADRLDERGAELISRIIRNTSRMTDLIENLLNYALAGRTDKPMIQVDLSATLRDVMSSLDAVIEDKKAIVQIGKLPTVCGDKTSLGQLFQNLISNGIKFCKNATPTIEIDSYQEHNQWHITVKDNGIGIDPQFFQQIFLPLKRLHRKDEYEGSGIGLATCKKILDQHGWTCNLTSEIGKGTTFHFTLPSQ